MKTSLSTRRGRLNQAVTIRWAPHGLTYPELQLPAGLRTRFLPDPKGGRWVLDEFPLELFPAKSFVRHDAVHYGLTLEADLITEETP